MTKDTKERTAELAAFAKKRALRFYAAADQLDATVRFMEENHIDYGEAYAKAKNAAHTVREQAHVLWTEYKGAEDIITGKRMPMFSQK